MTAFGLVGAKGAPGVTTSALLLAAVWPRPACLVEADPAGGDVRGWQRDPDGQPLRPDTGVVSLLAAHRTPSITAAGAPAADLLAHTQTLAGGLPVLLGVSTPAQHQALAPSWSQLAAAITTSSRPGEAAHDVVVDAGRLTPDPATRQLLGALPLVLLVCRPTVSSISHARHVLDALRHLDPPLAQHPTPGRPGPALGVIVIGTPAERDAVRTALALDQPPRDPRQAGVFVGQLADDRAAAAGLAGTWTRRLDRSPLVASGRRLATDLHAHLQHFAPPPEPDALPPRPAVLAGELR